MLRLRSAINRLFFEWRRRLAWKRFDYHEKPADHLGGLSFFQEERINQLKDAYHISFEQKFSQSAAIENYFVLDLLDQARKKMGFKPSGGAWVDVGSRSFAYAGALQKFLNPEQLTGIELDAFPIFADWHTRFSQAQFYMRDCRNTKYHVGDFLDYRAKCDGLILLYPFVTQGAHLAWHLPLSRFQPELFFQHAAALLSADGWMFMVNHGEEEREISRQLAAGSGFVLVGEFVCQQPIDDREITPVVSVYRSGKAARS